MSKNTPKKSLIPGTPEAKNAHADLIPREALADLEGRNMTAMSPDVRPMLQVTPAVAQTLQRGIAELVIELETARTHWDRESDRRRRGEEVLRVYVQFLENITKGKQDAGYIREAVTHLLGIMY
jgi:hypothetical protein